MGERVVILGVGLHPFGRHPEKSVGELARVAALGALKDAGVQFKDVQAGFCGHVVQGVGAGLRTFGEVGLTGIPITNVELACASSSRAAMLAADAISGGIYDLAMVIGVEKMERGLLSGVGGAEGGYQAKMGINLMPALYAMMAQRHMHLYGTKHEHFAQVSVKSHRNGALNPNAQYQKPLTLEDVLNSRMIADPITLYECSPTTDGASAVILASEKKAKQYTKSPVYMDTWEGGTPQYVRGESDFLEGPNTMLAQRVYEKAGIGPEDVDVAQVHAKEQIAVEPPYRQASVHVVVGLADDEAAEPFLEPGGLGDDHRRRRHADDEGAEKGDHLERASRERHPDS